MIVTRRRRKAFPWKRLGLPLLAILLVTVALSWTPSRNAIANGPLAPVWRTVGTAAAPVAAPFHFAAQERSISDRDHQIAQLSQRLNDAQKNDQSKDKQITDLQTQVGQLQTQAANASAKPVAPRAAAPQNGETAFASMNGGSTAGVAGGDLANGSTADMKRTAQFWANMDPENAAKVVQKLPTVYVARVFANMSPDSVGPILDALPPAYAAQVTQEHPELRR